MVRKKAFDEFASEYDRWFDVHKLEYELELKAISALLPEAGDGVEIGAGTGRFARPLGVSLGVEPSESMRAIAVGRGVNVIAGTAESLPVESECYQYALLTTTVCFLDELEIAFSEVRRILKPGGYIVVGLIDKNSTLGKKYETTKSTSRFYSDATFHSVDDIRNELMKLGFENFDYVQAVLPGDVGHGSEPDIKPGYGEGSFVVLRAQKPNN